MNEKIKVIIGDESKEFGCMLANSLRGRGFFAVTRDSDGLMLLEAIRSEEPDVVIVDSIIPGIDAAELIKRCDSFVHKPFFIVTSAYRNLFAERQIMSMENAYFMLKPFDCYLEVGMGCDIYLPFFKLNPELKFCFGLADILKKNRKDLIDSSLLKYTKSLDGASSKLIVLTVYFE